jgi:S-adenosylmethionine:tRNA ribosyltransferase-isomerase
MDLGVLDYTLDPALIAQHPLSTRDASRLLVVERATGRWTHDVVQHLDEWLRPGDILVANDAQVIAARLYGKRPTGGTIEVLLVEPLDDDRYWRCIARGAGRIPVGEEITFGAGLTGTWGERLGDVFRAIRITCAGDLAATLRAVGEIPLPPYIRRPDGPSGDDRERYQTMFARTPGAIAAPTAGLHFTPELIDRLAARGVPCVSLTLVDGPATFLPVRGDSLDDHSVPPERYDIPADTAMAINEARAAGRRVVAIGTTTARALESAVSERGVVTAGEGRTRLVIAPGHQFRGIDALFTNFHLPRSSLLALVAAFAGTETTLAAYRAAVASSYRFYSYGDAMLIV